MKEYMAFDSHKHYTLVEHEEVATGKVRQYRIEQRRSRICRPASWRTPDRLAPGATLAR